ncbi:MAG: flavodoxin family protein [Clostridia bacterium]|nr:flavodoxin family protein [Clostridia bacterium]
MKLIITDIVDFKPNISDEYHVVAPQKNAIVPCVGCFGCWTKTPGECLIKDGYSSVAARIGKCDELVIVSKCFYGGFSPFVKNVLDRAIGYILPDFVIRNGVMKHKSRYGNTMRVSACFYGENISDAEKSTAKRIVRANAENYNAKLGKVEFCRSAEETAGVCF